MKTFRIFLAVLLTLPVFQHAVAQTDPVLMTIGGTNITKSEFEKVYKKNNKDVSYDSKSVKEYLELYINYKLKVKEAEEEKLDTSEAFINELKGYRKQLAQPYLTDKDVTDNLVKEAYDRMKKDVRSSHILFKLAPDALPKDTLAAYNKAMKVREKIMKGSDFNMMAKEYSEDPSAKENGGDLGYFTGMQMVYPFETAAYGLKPGEVSMPVRTRYGYHLIKVTDIRDAQGEIHTAHIMIKTQGNNDKDSVNIAAKQKIDEIYKKLKAGEKFDDLATQYSDDKGSARSGGILPWFGTGRMVPEFEKAAFALKADGDYSEPVKTSYGWHIIKRIEKRGIPSFEDKQNELKTMVARDSRAELSKTSLVNRIKKEYNFKEVPKAKDELINSLDSSLANGEYDPKKSASFTKPLFTIGNKTYTQADFAGYLFNHQTKKAGTNSQKIANMLYDQFVTEMVLAYEEENLDNKYPDFKSLMQEYRDGILLFDLTDTKVWSKAMKDSAGLANYYEMHKNAYMWGERVDAIVYSAANKEIAANVHKMLKKKGSTPSSIADNINKDSQLNLTIKEGKFAKGDNELVDSVKWVKGMSPDMNRNGQVSFVEIKEVIPPTPKTLDEAKGLVTADYQTYLEKEWIETLRKKYPVKVNEEVLNTIGK
jgi:peptidyl-prolyl cis-trans isomerase SurA